MMQDDRPTTDVAHQVVGGATFETFYRTEFARVAALAHALSGSRWAAEELTQDAFLAAFGSWDTIDNPEGWVRTTVTRMARSAIRRRRAEARALTRLGRPREATIDPMPSDTARFWAEVRRLPARQSHAFALYYVDDRPTAEIAEILGCAESTVRVHLARARTTLSRRLEARP